MHRLTQSQTLERTLKIGFQPSPSSSLLQPCGTDISSKDEWCGRKHLCKFSPSRCSGTQGHHLNGEVVTKKLGNARVMYAYVMQ